MLPCLALIASLQEVEPEVAWTLGLELAYTYQRVTRGGWEGPAFEAFSDEDDDGHVASGDLAAELDTGKAGLWDGGTWRARVDARAGRSVLRRAGGVAAVNNDALFPNVADRFDEEALAVTELTATQDVGGGFALFAGLLNAAEGDENEIAGAALSNATFLNAALLYSLVEDATVPHASLGGGVEIDAGERLSGSVSAFGSAETAGENPFKSARGTTFATEWTVGHGLDGLPGAQTFGFLYGINARRVNIAADPRRTLGELLQGQALPRTEEDTWAAYYNAHQFLRGDAAGGWGVFARLGLSDGDPNPVKWNAALGVGGVGTLPSRPDDRWGLGAYYLDLSDEALLESLRVDDEVGGELFYAVAVTSGFRVTLDAQVVHSALPDRDTAVVLGLRTRFVF
ncbi:MAG TPA: carbohydrate porin [Planctomycetota bacterium]